jgi:hypothetical protein
MKRVIFIVLITVAFGVGTISGLYSMEFIVGAKVWYANWDPVLKDAGKEVPWMGWQHFETGSGWLYGPNVGITLSDRFNLSVSYLYGKMYAQFEADYRAAEGSEGTILDYSLVGKNDITRQDLDSALSYQLFSWLKVFAGLKYQICDSTMKQSGGQWYVSGPGGSHTDNDGFLKVKMKFKQTNYAPALGLGVSYALGSMFALTANLSALYMKGAEDISHQASLYRADDFTGPTDYGSFDLSMDIEGYGVNVEPAILLFLNDINTIIVLGFRYQYVNYDGTWDDPPEGVDKTFENMSDMLYGAYFSVLYKF